MRVIGFDAALGRTGWAVVTDDVVDKVGAIETKAKRTRPERLRRLWHEALEVVRENRDATTIVVIERPGRWVRGKDATGIDTIEVMAQARGVIAVGAAWQDVPVLELDVNEARELVLAIRAGEFRRIGGRTAGGIKVAIRKVLAQRLGYDLGPDADAVDAAVVALAGYSLWKSRDPRFPYFQTPAPASPK